jgi:hypothetical protein
MKETKMKIFNNPRHFIVLSCVAVSALGLLAPTLTLAQGKGASKLMFAAPTGQTQAQVVASSRSEMPCPRCTDDYAKVANTFAKGMQAGSMRTVSVHLCTSCQTKIVSVGVGKAKTDQAVHSCGMNGKATASCCMAAK